MNVRQESRLKQEHHSALRGLPGAFWRCRRGLSSVEFGLLAPILFFALLAMVDLGLALFQRMTVDHVLRAGAQSAMADGGEPEVLNVLKSTAEKNFALAGASTPSEDPLSLAVSRYSACPQDPDTAVDIATICTGPQPTSIFYRLSAEKTHRGMILPDMMLDRAMRVQIR